VIGAGEVLRPGEPTGDPLGESPVNGVVCALTPVADGLTGVGVRAGN
jgi:hypothetical protein